MIPYRDCIVFLLTKAQQRAQAAIRERLRPLGLTPVQGLLLNALFEEEGLPVGEVGRRIGLDTATLAGVLDRMSGAEWIRREADPEDGRVGRIYATDKAREAAPAIYGAVEQANEDVLRDFSLEEKVLLKRLLRDMRG